MNPAEQILRDGAALLEPKLRFHGFVFKVTGRGMSSGGEFAEGQFHSGDREGIYLHWSAKRLPSPF